MWKNIVRCLSHHKSVQSCVYKNYKTAWAFCQVRKVQTDVRNIGIMAHIDAGKTTTTERMLYYSGFIKFMGDIDAGTTVMDYLPSERERGITVQSAAISFKWLNHQLNLIDTPGHVDFTIEVERSLRVLDGAVAIFDASRGVEAQSRTVWRQADHNNIPRIAFINKMDKQGADFGMSICSMKDQLKANTLLLQVPLIENGVFTGGIDVVNMEKIKWDMSQLVSSNASREFHKEPIDCNHEDWKNCMTARTNIIEQLAELYDDVASAWLEGPNAGEPSLIPASELKSWVRRATLENKIVPTLCGSALKNVGVQPLLDAVVSYLPRPVDVQHAFLDFYTDSLVAMAFKIVHDKRHGPLLFVRVYSGSLNTGGKIYNPNKACYETISKLMKVYADDFQEVQSIASGSIGVISGFKQTVTGDTLVSSEEHYNQASWRAEKISSDEGTNRSAAVLTAVPVPEPVFFRSILAESLIHEKRLDQALAIICREDPSIRIKRCDDDSLMLCGLGELHLDIVAERIREEFKVKSFIGPVQVAYREMPTEEARHKMTVERTALDKKHTVTVDVHVEPCDRQTPMSESSVVRRGTNPLVEQAAALGILQECQRGSVLGYPLMGAKITLKKVHASSGCPPGVISASASRCTKQALLEAECQVMEPMMNVEVTSRAEMSMDAVVAELNKRHADIVDVCGENLVAEAAVAEMKDFTSVFRSVTSGNADLTLRVIGYRPASDERVFRIKQVLSGASSS